MGSEAIYFILGLLVSVPVGIGVNLYTPRLQAQLASRNDKRAARLREVQKRREEEMQLLARDPNSLKEEMLTALLKLAYVSALFSAIASFFSLVGYGVGRLFDSVFEVISALAFSASVVVSLAGLLLALTIAGNALNIISSVRSIRGESPSASSGVNSSPPPT